mmetsp:Transcript_6737/g.15449  ORF Transcript_6737/g.15449 Transcript_6737/m.15449 type:complete len:364 (-) Transcript_6737:32-1123(-)
MRLGFSVVSPCVRFSSPKAIYTLKGGGQKPIGNRRGSLVRWVASSDSRPREQTASNDLARDSSLGGPHAAPSSVRALRYEHHLVALPGEHRFVGLVEVHPHRGPLPPPARQQLPDYSSFGSPFGHRLGGFAQSKAMTFRFARGPHLSGRGSIGRGIIGRGVISPLSQSEDERVVVLQVEEKAAVRAQERVAEPRPLRRLLDLAIRSAQPDVGRRRQSSGGCEALGCGRAVGRNFGLFPHEKRARDKGPLPAARAQVVTEFLQRAEDTPVAKRSRRRPGSADLFETPNLVKPLSQLDLPIPLSRVGFFAPLLLLLLLLRAFYFGPFFPFFACGLLQWVLLHKSFLLHKSCTRWDLLRWDLGRGG